MILKFAFQSSVNLDQKGLLQLVQLEYTVFVYIRSPKYQIDISSSFLIFWHRFPDGTHFLQYFQ